MCRYSYLYIHLPPSNFPSIRGNGGAKLKFLLNKKWKHDNFPIIFYRQPLEKKTPFDICITWGLHIVIYVVIMEIENYI